MIKTMKKVWGIPYRCRIFFLHVYHYRIYKCYPHKLFISYTHAAKIPSVNFSITLWNFCHSLRSLLYLPCLEHCYSGKLQSPLTNFPFIFCIQNEDMYNMLLEFPLISFYRQVCFPDLDCYKRYCYKRIFHLLSAIFKWFFLFQT